MHISGADKGMQRANFQQRFFWSSLFLHCVQNSIIVLVEQDLYFFIFCHKIEDHYFQFIHKI